MHYRSERRVPQHDACDSRRRLRPPAAPRMTGSVEIESASAGRTDVGNDRRAEQRWRDGQRAGFNFNDWRKYQDKLFDKFPQLRGLNVRDLEQNGRSPFNRTARGKWLHPALVAKLAERISLDFELAWLDIINREPACAIKVRDSTKRALSRPHRVHATRIPTACTLANHRGE